MQLYNIISLINVTTLQKQT